MEIYNSRDGGGAKIMNNYEVKKIKNTILSFFIINNNVLLLLLKCCVVEKNNTKTTCTEKNLREDATENLC